MMPNDKSRDATKTFSREVEYTSLFAQFNMGKMSVYVTEHQTEEAVFIQEVIIANELGQMIPLEATSETTLDVSAKCFDICAVQNYKQTHSQLTTCCVFPCCFSISSGRS